MNRVATAVWLWNGYQGCAGLMGLGYGTAGDRSRSTRFICTLRLGPRRLGNGSSVLLIAAGLKCHQFATSPAVGGSVLESRWVMMAAVEFEQLFGLCRLANVTHHSVRVFSRLVTGRNPR